MTEEVRQNKEIEYVAYKLTGDEDYELLEFVSRSELNRHFGRNETGVIPVNHRIYLPNLKDAWFVFRSSEKVNYIQAVLERQI